MVIISNKKIFKTINVKYSKNSVPVAVKKVLPCTKKCSFQML